MKILRFIALSIIVIVSIIILAFIIPWITLMICFIILMMIALRLKFNPDESAYSCPDPGCNCGYKKRKHLDPATRPPPSPPPPPRR